MKENKGVGWSNTDKLKEHYTDSKDWLKYTCKICGGETITAYSGSRWYQRQICIECYMLEEKNLCKNCKKSHCFGCPHFDVSLEFNGWYKKNE